MALKLATAMVLVLLAAALFGATAVAAKTRIHVTGGGTGTFHADLDADGDIDGSHFGMGIQVHEDGTAKGRFECLMAGNTDILGLPVMAVAGRVHGATINSPTSVTITGVAKVILGHGDNFDEVPFEATLTAGGPGDGTIQLHLMGGYEGGPGDFDLPVEEVATGQIKIH